MRHELDRRATAQTHDGDGSNPDEKYSCRFVSYGSQRD